MIICKARFLGLKFLEVNKKTHIYVGAYHFFSFESTGKEQAEHFINIVEKIDNMLPPVVDVEYYEGMKEKPSVNNLRAELDDMLECLEEHYGCKPIIYSTMSVYEKYLDDYYNEYHHFTTLSMITK